MIITKVAFEYLSKCTANDYYSLSNFISRVLFKLFYMKNNYQWYIFFCNFITRNPNLYRITTMRLNFIAITLDLRVQFRSIQKYYLRNILLIGAYIPMVLVKVQWHSTPATLSYNDAHINCNNIIYMPYSFLQFTEWHECHLHT